MGFKLKLWPRKNSVPALKSFTFDRPLVVLQSDDWGRVGVRDREGYEMIRAAGLRLGEHAYDSYTLETAEDVAAVQHLLQRHRDSTGRSPVMVMNFIMGNVNFAKSAQSGYKELHVLSLDQGLPGQWSRPGLFEGYRRGISDGVFYPALHGLTHFCSRAVEHALSRGGERAELLKTLWKAETPYIYWRMPWVGYEYRNPERPHAGFLPESVQLNLISEAARIYQLLFSHPPASACAPGFRADRATNSALSKVGVLVAQNGSGSPLPPHMDEKNVLQLHRTIDFEPSQRDLAIEKYMQLADDCFSHGIPAIISVHSINFHSTLKDFRTPTLQTLDSLLSALEAKYPNLLYVHDRDIYDIVTRGKFRTPQGAVSVTAKQHYSQLRAVIRGDR